MVIAGAPSTIFPLAVGGPRAGISVGNDAQKIAACDNADPLAARAAMIDAPPFDPPYFSIEKTAQGARVIETCADGSRTERMVSAAEAAGLLVDMSNRPPAATVTARSIPKSRMPPGSTVLAVPFAEKDAAKKLGARWNAERRSWYVPAGVDVSLFARWRTDEADS